MAALDARARRELDVPLGIVLEGGYELGALSRSVVATLEAVGAAPGAGAPEVALHPLAERAQERLAAYWPALA